jgi:hypothetical protein
MFTDWADLQANRVFLRKRMYRFTRERSGRDPDTHTRRGRAALQLRGYSIYH